jgi:tartrate dehydrogenase/decarboxylase/D-malate dehydrogenase
LGESSAAAAVDRAVRAVLAEGKVRTPDLGGTASTTEVQDAVLAAL